MVRAVVPRHRAGEWPFIVTGLGKAKTERFDGSLTAHQGGDRSHGARIDSPAQEEPERHIADELVADRVLELLSEGLGPVGRVHGLVRGK